MTASIEQISAQMAERLTDVRGGLELARAALKEVEVEESRLAKALRALDPEHPLVAAPEKPAPVATPVTVRPRKQVSDELAARVFAAVQDQQRPVTIRQIHEHYVTDVSTSAIGLALDRLREEQLVRLAGQAEERGKPNLFAPMNGGTHA